MDGAWELLFIDHEEDEISFAVPALVKRKTFDETTFSCNRSVVVESILSPMCTSSADAREKSDTQVPIKSPQSISGMVDRCQAKVNIWEDEDMLRLALQRRFENHKADMSSLSDLSLFDSTADDKSYAANCQDQSVASLEFVANCSMPQLEESHSDKRLASPVTLHCSSTWRARDLDTTAKFLELEKSCLTPTKPDECQSELSTDDLSTVSADADGGFLKTFTSLALIHPTLNRDGVAMSPFSPARVKTETLCTEDLTSGERETIYTSTLTALHDRSDFLTDDSNTDLTPNTTFDEMMMLESYGPLYMVSAEKDLTKRGMESFVNATLSKDQQSMLDSISDQNVSIKPGVMRDISHAFEPYSSTLPSPLPKDEKDSNSVLASSEEFQFPKPLSTVAGSNSKPKYRHQTTPAKVFSPKPAPTANSAGSGIFSGSSKVRTPLLPPKGKFFSPVRDIPKTRIKTPVANVKMTADLKKIQSPIGHYINDSPVPSLMARKHVPFAGLHKTKFLSADIHEEKKASENVDVNNMAERKIALPPQKSYQSTSSLQMMTPSRTKLPMMGGKSKQLVSTPKPIVMKHTGRVKVSHLPSNSPVCKITPQLVNDSCISEKTFEAEVSVVVTREATKTTSIK